MIQLHQNSISRCHTQFQVHNNHFIFLDTKSKKWLLNNDEIFKVKISSSKYIITPHLPMLICDSIWDDVHHDERHKVDIRDERWNMVHCIQTVIWIYILITRQVLHRRHKVQFIVKSQKILLCWRFEKYIELDCMKQLLNRVMYIKIRLEVYLKAQIFVENIIQHSIEQFSKINTHSHIQEYKKAPFRCFFYDNQYNFFVLFR